MRLRRLTVMFSNVIFIALEYIRFLFNCLGRTQLRVSTPFKYLLSRSLFYLSLLIITLRRHETVLSFRGNFNQFERFFSE